MSVDITSSSHQTSTLEKKINLFLKQTFGFLSKKIRGNEKSTNINTFKVFGMNIFHMG